MDRRWRLAIGFVSILFTAVSYAESIDLATSPDEVNFLARASYGVKIRGEISDKARGVITGAGEDFSGRVTVKLSNLDTGISLRNSHTLKYLQADKFPEAVLNFQTKGQNFQGTLKLKGVEKKISGQFSKPFQLTFNISLEDFEIKTPVYLGVKVKDSVQVKAKVIL